MPWSPEPGAGFTSADDPWLPLGSDYAVRNVQSQLRDPDSHLHLYRRLLQLRRGSAPLRTGIYTPVDPTPPDCFVFERSETSERVLVAVNFSRELRSMDVADWAGQIAVSTQRASEGNVVRGTLHLLPHEAVVVV